MTTTRTFNDADRLLSETNSGGTLSGLSITNGYDQFLRRTNVVSLNSANVVLSSAAYGYDSASRLQTVTDNTGATAYSATYSYLANSPLLSQIVDKQSGTTRMTVTKQYDYLNRLTSVSSAPSADSSLSFGYQYNAAGQRTRVTMADNSYWQYVYDSLGQVLSGHKFFSDETPVAGQLFDYSFDTIGNRTQTLAGGDQSAANQRVSTYSANNLNQYTQRTVPAYADVMGLGFATNAVTVNSQTAYRKVEYFRDQLAVNNSSAALWTNMVVSETNQASVSGNVFIPLTPETYSYDLDGNVAQDGRWAYTWDAENRLVSLQALSGIPNGAKYTMNFVYDPLGRRIQKLVSTNSGSGYVAQSTNRYVYDGWELLTIVNPQSAVIQSFLWGTDISGSPQGAGGAGGLLEINDIANGIHFATCDANGNIVDLAKAADGTLSCRYEYGPFGDLLRATGPMSRTNALRFSTKFYDDEDDFMYYGYRYYNPSAGRWLSRDLIAERGGAHLYAFTANSPLNSTDPVGLADLEYWSDGEVHYNGHLDVVGVWIGEVDRSYSQSGIQSAPSAYFLQTVIENWGCTGGICNSTLSSSTSSEISAKVKNVGPCPLTLNCTCTVRWFVSSSSPGERGKRGAKVWATVLDHSIYKDYSRARKQPDGSYLAVGTDSVTKTKQFILKPGQSRDLYKGHDNITSANSNPGAGFHEDMSGDCTCNIFN